MERFGISKELEEACSKAEEVLAPIFKEYDDRAMRCSMKVLQAFQEERVSTANFVEVCGYGFEDGGRDKLERIVASIFGAEDSLVRPQIMSGTHAITLCLSALARHGDTLLSVSGRPYETLQNAIGLVGDSESSLIKCGVKYEEINLVNNDFDYEAIRERVSQKNVKLIEIQRSRGYAQRKSITMDKIEKVIKVIREADPNVIIMVDNCYGVFVEDTEPTMVGADIIAGSMMKNLGGALALSGGYVAGKEKYVHLVAERLSVPGIGKELGANFNQLRSFYMGVFLSPSMVASALKTMTLAAYLLEQYDCKNITPRYNERRTDIVQTIDLPDERQLVAFCQGMQKGSPVDSHVTPYPEVTPGYTHPEIMAGGTFIPGATLELSCDAPVVAPYTAFMQGGITYEYGKLNVLMGIQGMLNERKSFSK